MRARHFVSLAAFSACLVAASARADWKELGPAPLTSGNGGRVTTLAPHPTDATIYYVGAASGGVWKSQGGTYTPLTDQMPIASIGSIAVDPKNPSIIYAGTGEPDAGLHAFYGVGIYKSTDAGATWTVIGGPTFGGRAISKIAISPMDSQVLFASVTHNALGYPGGIVAAKGHPGASGPGGVFRSSNGGTTWSQVAGGLPAVDASDIAIAPDDPNTIYVAIGAALGNAANGVYKSTNGGDSWTKLAGGLPNNGARIALAMAPSNSSRIYAAISSPGTEASSSSSNTVGIFVTSNGGMSWTSTNPGNYMSFQGNYDNTAIVDPKNPDIAYFGGVQALKTTNAGGSYQMISALHGDYHALAFLANGDLLIGQDGGVNKSTNGGSSWTGANVGLGISQFYPGISIHPTNADFVLGGLQDNGSVVRGNANNSWRAVLGGDGGYTALNPKAPDVMFAEIYDATNLNRSTNGGQSFSKASTGIGANDRTAFYDVVVPTSDPQVFLVGTNRVYKSTNAGQSWTALSGDVTGGAPDAIRAMAVSPTNAMIVWVATTDDRVSVSTDGGTTFTKKLDAPGWKRVTRELAVAPWDEKTAFVAVQRFGVDQVRMTKNLGDAWTGIDGDLPDVPADSIDAAVVGGQNMIFVGTDSGVYFTCNEGQHWARLGKALPNVVVADIRYDAMQKRVVAGTFGRGIWSIEEPTAAGCTGPGGPDGGLTTGAGGAGGSGAGAGGASGGAAGAGGVATGSGGEGGAGPVTSGGGSPTGSGGNVTGGNQGAGGNLATGGAPGATTGPGGAGESPGCACTMRPSSGGAALSFGLLGIASAFARRRRRQGGGA